MKTTLKKKEQRNCERSKVYGRKISVYRIWAENKEKIRLSL